jgi:hypothetical protein
VCAPGSRDLQKSAKITIQVIKETHGKTSQLSQADLDALVRYLKSLQ